MVNRSIFLFISILVTMLGSNAFASDLKIWLSSNSIINSQLYLASDSESSTPGTISGQHLKGTFKLKFNGSLSQTINFSPDDPVNWAKVVTSTSGVTTVVRMPDLYFTFSRTPIKFRGPLGGTALGVHVQKSDKLSFPLVNFSQDSVGFSLDNKILNPELGKFAFSSGSRNYSAALGTAIHPHLTEQFNGIWLVPYENSANVEFSLLQEAQYTKFTLPSRQGCSLNLTRHTKISASETEVNFMQTGDTSRLPIFKYWSSSSSNTQEFEFSVDRITMKEDSLVVHDPSMNSCMCMSINLPTGNLADSCHECSCE